MSLKTLNTFEEHSIQIANLPVSWQGDGLIELEKFLHTNWEQRKAFYNNSNNSGEQQFISFSRRKIKMNNYVGTIIFKNVQLNIFPKVYPIDPEDDEEPETWDVKDLVNNLTKWLSYCDKMNFPFVAMKAEISKINNLQELFILTYVKYVVSIINKAPYYKYEEITETSGTIRGKIDFKDYISNKYPKGLLNKFNLTRSEYQFNNKLNQIIKCVCKHILSMTKIPSVKKELRRILTKLNTVTEKECQPSDCDQIHLSWMQSQYKIILSMSKIFLLNKMTSYEGGNMESFCFLFPAEYLFEGFVGGYISEALKGVAKVKLQANENYLGEAVLGGESLGSAFNLRDDIVIEKGENVFVLDTKYKKIKRFVEARNSTEIGINADDMRQIATYVYKRHAKKGFLIYPLFKGEDPETLPLQYNIEPYVAHAETIPIHILKVPFLFETNKDPRDYIKRIIEENIN